jgi:hypothetical protein
MVFSSLPTVWGPPMADAIALPRRTVNYPWVALVAALTLLLGWAANAVIAVVTDWAGSQAWLAVPVATVVVTMLTAVVTAHVNSFEPAARDATGQAVHDRPSPPIGRSRSFLVSAALVTLLIGVIGFGLTVGARFVVGWITGDETGVDRLVEPVSHSDRGLSLTVESIDPTRHFTRVTAVATNRVGNPVTLTLFRNAVLQARSGTTVRADSFRSDWVEELPPGATQRGVIVFGGHLPDEVRFARLSFSSVFEQGFHGPDSIAVTGMRLHPPDEAG